MYHGIYIYIIYIQTNIKMMLLLSHLVVCFFDIDIIDTEYACRLLYPNHPMIFA